MNKRNFDTKDDDEITVVFKRKELNAFHRACESGLVNLDASRGTESRAAYASMMLDMRNKALAATYKRDGVPHNEWPPEIRR